MDHAAERVERVDQRVELFCLVDERQEQKRAADAEQRSIIHRSGNDLDRVALVAGHVGQKTADGAFLARQTTYSIF